VNVAKQARRLAGYEVPELPGNAVFRGGYQREGYRIEKYALLGGDNEVVPLILRLLPGDGKRPVVIYLHPVGKAGGAAAGGPIEALVRRGYLVAAPDLAGTGETALEIGRQNDRNAAFYTGLLTSHSVVGLQVTDLARVIAWLQSRNDVQSENIGVVAVGSLGPAAIHAAALVPGIRWLALERTPVSYAFMVMNRFYVFPTSCMVAGALTAYDLPDLLACFAPRKIAVVGPVDEKAPALSEADLLRILQYPLDVHSSHDSRDQVKLVSSATEGTIAEIADWGSTPS